MATDDFMLDEIEIVYGGGPPPGAYRAAFEGVRRTEHEEYGPGLRFEFRVLDGPQTGAIAARTTSAKPSPSNAAGKLIASITGAALVGGQKASLSSVVGRTFLIVVEAGTNGKGSKVANVVAQ
jgi:hypothetical protein